MSNRAAKKAAYVASKLLALSLQDTSKHKREVEESRYITPDNLTSHMSVRAKRYNENPTVTPHVPDSLPAHVFKGGEVPRHSTRSDSLDRSTASMLRKTDCGQPRRFKNVVVRKLREDERGRTSKCPGCC